MKRLFPLLAFVLVLNAAFAQQSTFDARLLVKFTNEQLTEMQNDKPDELAFWEFFINDGFLIYTITKDAARSDIGSISYDDDIDNLNPLALGLEPEETAVRTYQIGDTDKGLMILSRQKILAKMSKEK